MQLVDTAAAEKYVEYVQKNNDPYGKAIVTYSERWATAMEQEIADDKKNYNLGPAMVISYNAKRLSHDADTEGITGFMYGCAVDSLARFWVHGEALRHWHNLDCQIGDEGVKANESGGVLNPALISIVTTPEEYEAGIEASKKNHPSAK